MFVSDSDDEDQFLRRLVDDLDAEYAIGTEEEQSEDEDPDEDPMKDEDPAEDEDPVEDLAEDEDLVEDPMEGEGLVPVEEDPQPAEADQIVGEEEWIDDPLGESDEKGDDVPLEDVDGGDHIDWDTELQHLDDIPEEEMGIWIDDLDEELREEIPFKAGVEEEEEEEEVPVVVDPILEEVHQTDEVEGTMTDMVQQAQQEARMARRMASTYADMLEAERRTTVYLRALLEQIRADQEDVRARLA